MSVQAINRRFRVQHGLISRHQALQHLSGRQIERKLESGEWQRERRGVYRTTAVSRTFEARCLSQTLGRQAVISHRAAAALSGLEPFTTPRAEITVPYGARTRGQFIHVSSQWAHRDQLMRRGVPCTGIDRTIMDCAGVVPVPTLEIMAESAIRQGLTSWSALNDYLVCHAARGRTGAAGLRALLEKRAGSPTITRSTFSLRVAHLLTKAGLPEPRVEHKVSDPNGKHILALDLAWPDRKKAWELDGLEWHFGRSDIMRDKSKRNSVKSQGWAIQEILWDMYLDTPEQLISWARDFLR